MISKNKLFTEISIGPFRAHGPSAKPAEPGGLPEAYGSPHGPPKVHGPWGLCTPGPPLGGPAQGRQEPNVARGQLKCDGFSVL